MLQVIYDTDGMIIHREMYFSERLAKDFFIPLKAITPFFKNEFQSCLVGRSDLKQEIQKYLSIWNWTKTVDDLLAFWFQSESALNQDMLDHVTLLRAQGIRCYLGTNNEKYRVQYLRQDLDLEKSFDGIFASSSIGFRKPQIEFWQAVENGLGNLDKNQVIVWDNEIKNVESAKEFGFQAELYSDFATYKNKMALLCRL